MIFHKHINKYYLKYGPMLLLGLFALILVDYFQLMVPEIYRNVINGMNHGFVETAGNTYPFDIDYLLDYVCLPMIKIILIMVFGRFLWRVCFFGAAVRMETDLRNRMFSHSIKLSQEYYQINKVGNLMSLYTNDIDTIQECFGDGVLMFFDAAFLGALSFVKMWNMDHKLTLFSLIPLLFFMLIGLTISKAMEKSWAKRQQAFSNLSDFAQENFSGIAVVKAFVKETKELMAFRKLNKEHEDTNINYTKISVCLNILITLFVESIICVILGFGGYMVYIKSFDAGQLVEFIGYFSTIVWPFMAIAMLIEKSSRGKASMKRIAELLDAKEDVCDREDVTELSTQKVNGKIEFSHLSFRYPDGEFDVLKDVSFVINAGESVGIVGKTGAGKTTLVDLILRTYNVNDKTLFINDQDVNDVSIASVRKTCAYVPQDNFLFSDTIMNNIAFSNDLCSEKEKELVKNAAVLADVDSNICGFSQGYETVLGERGVTVSGGQKQRISIARALYKDAPILILDDSVSAVDTKTEKTILDGLKKARAGRTTILIAHRISTVEHMDKIIYLSDGQVLAVGTHEELLAGCREYANLVLLQTLEDEEGGSANA